MTDNKELVRIKESIDWDEALENESWVAPLVDIYETEDNFFLVASMPGVAKDAAHVKLEDGSLVMMGRIEYEEVTKRKYVLQENELGNYYRKFNVSDSIDSNKIDARFENGQLAVTLPKHERIKPKTISIN